MNGLRWAWTARRPFVDPDEAAVRWVTQRESDPVRFKGERDAFEAWLAEPENAAAWARIDRCVDEVGQFASLPEVREMRRAALEATRRRPRAHRVWLGGGALAASLLVMVALLAVSDRRLADPEISAEPSRVSVRQRHATGVGERMEIALEDGSRITLNTASKVEIHYSAARRDVLLLDGQALFRVAKDSSRPFVVAAGDRLITAIGTAFDVRVRRNGEVDVMLMEGKVNVDPMRPTGLARWMPALERERLKPGQLLLARTAEAPLVAVGDVERVTAWDRGLLIFRNDRVGEAVEEINRYSRTQLMIEDLRIRELKVSGVFTSARPEDFVAALEAFYPIHVERSAGVVVLQWRAADGSSSRQEQNPAPAVRKRVDPSS